MEHKFTPQNNSKIDGNKPIEEFVKAAKRNNGEFEKRNKKLITIAEMNDGELIIELLLKSTYNHHDHCLIVSEHKQSILINARTILYFLRTREPAKTTDGMRTSVPISVPKIPRATYNHFLTNIVKTVLKLGVKPIVKDHHGSTILHIASRLGLTEISESLIKAGENPNAKNNDGDTPLIIASKEGHPETAKLLRKYGAVG